jgi:flagellar protein FlgJ
MTPPPPAASSAGSNYTDLNSLAALKNAPSSPEAVKAVAEQVEALFLQMMLKSMRDATQAESGETVSNETSMYQDMFDKQVALTLSKHQDLGIARLFERQLANQSSADPAHAGAAAAPGSSPQREKTHGEPGSPSAPTSTNLSEQAAAFVAQVLPSIRRVASGLGVSPLGLLAQAALETGWGQRMPRTADGTPSLNLFGIKAGEEWEGARAVADTVEFSGGVAAQRRTAFRAYGSIEESVGDFARLLANSPRYRTALAAGTTAQGYIQSIAQSGYATDPDYGNKLNQILNSGTLRSALKSRTVAL